MTKKMPDEIWATVTPGVKTTSGYWSVIDKINPNRSNKQPRIKFIRSEPVEALLKQARDALRGAHQYMGRGYIGDIEHLHAQIGTSITAIDAALSGKENGTT